MQFSIKSGNFAKEAGVVSDDHFGAVYSTFYGMDAFKAQSEALGVTDMRWPGGTRGEYQRDFKDVDGDGDTSEYLFSLTHDNMMEIHGKGLSDMLSHARDAGIDLTIFVPSVRYLDDEQSAYADTLHFAKRLLDGDFGDLPEKLTIEIGNETLDGTTDRASAYGSVANMQVAAIREALANRDTTVKVDIDIAVQIGRSATEDAAIRAQFAKENLAEIEGLIAHHLPINIYNHNAEGHSGHREDAGDNRFTRNVDYVENWETAVARAGNLSEIDLDLLITAWTVGSSSEIADRDLEWNDIGARQGRTTLDTFANLIGAGADAMSLWGVDGRPNPNFYSKPGEDGIELSHGGVVFEMMASSLVGKALHSGFVQDWAVDRIKANDANVYVFEDASEYVIFIAANDIDAPVRVRLDVEGMNNKRAVKVKSLETSLDDAAPLRLDADALREWERPVTSESQFFSKTDQFDFIVEDAFDVHRLTIAKDASHPSIDHVLASKANGLVHKVAATGISTMTSESEDTGAEVYVDEFIY